MAKKKAKRRPKKRAKAKKRPKKRAKARPKKRAKARSKKRPKARPKKKPKKRSKARPKKRGKRAKRAKKKLKKHAKSRFKKAKKRLKKNAALNRKNSKTVVVRTEDGYFLEETFQHKSKFDDDSFRTIKPRPGVLITIGCPIGKWDRVEEKCSVSTQRQHKTKAITAAEAARLRRKGIKSASKRSNLVQGLLNRARHGKVSQRPKVLPGRKVRIAVNKGKKNFLLMTVTNPATATQLRRAKTAFKKWHLKGPSFATKVKVPDSYPNTMINLGQLEAFNYKTPGGQTRRWECPTGKKPTIAANAEGTRAYALGGDFKGLPAGSRMSMIHYRIPLPPRSNRVRLGSRRWYHPFDSPPVIHVNQSGGFWMSTPVKPEGFSG